MARHSPESNPEIKVGAQSMKRRSGQLSLFHPVGLPPEPTPSTDEHYIQVSAELKDRAAKEKHPSRQVAADVRHATGYLRY